MVVANQPDIMVVNKQNKKAVVVVVVIDVIPSDSKMRKKENEKLEKYLK